MKKIYSSMIMATAVVASVYAQNGNFGVMTKVKQFEIPSENRPSTEEPVLIGSRAPGDTIWYNDFSTPSDWVLTNNSSPAYDWEFTNTIPANLGGPLQSATDDQFILVNSDAQGATATQECYIQTANAINLSTYSGVNLVWTQYVVDFYDDNIIEVSTDGGNNWTSFPVNLDIAPNANSSNPDYRQLNISAVAGGQTAVLIRFKFVGAYGYLWAVDDVALVESEENDLGLTETFHSDIINDLEYEITPLSQVLPKYLGVVVENNGSVAQTNVMCEYDISFNNMSVNSGSFAVGSGTLAPAAMDTGWYDTGFTPDTAGEYTISYNIVSDSTDAKPANNSSERVFEISDTEWSHEREDLWDGEYGGYIVPDSDPVEMMAYSHGSLFIPVADVDLTAVKVSFGSLTSATSSAPMALTVEVHTLGASVQEIVDSEIQGVDIEGDGWKTFVLDDPIPMIAGTGYTVAVSTTGEPDVMTINGWGEDADGLGAVNYGPFGTGGAENWYTGWDHSPAIRAVLDPSVGISESDDFTVFNVYPNPADDLLQVNFVSKEDQSISIDLISSNGGLVSTESVNTKVGQSNRVSFSVDGLASGIYVVRIQGASSVATKRVVVR